MTLQFLISETSNFFSDDLCATVPVAIALRALALCSARTHTCARLPYFINTQTHTHTHTHKRTHARTHTQAHTSTRTRIPTFTHTRTHTHRRTHAPPRTNAHAHTHTPIHNHRHERPHQHSKCARLLLRMASAQKSGVARRRQYPDSVGPLSGTVVANTIGA